MIGTKLAHYEITAHLGSGGMGDVYQATDLKLKRSVAIKLLPADFSSDAERLSRFRREAQLLASLNHPNIAHIYGLEESGDKRCIIMELVEGETLQARLKRGPIPIDEALSIAKQICEALEAAHEKGVIHRDLKPGNVMSTGDGKVKVLDFGLAKAMESDPSDANLSNSPTLMSGGSMPGVILGTAAYMSPEQAKGRTVDKRTDIFAFGGVLYEMLTGKRTFDGDDVSDILARVLTSEPDWTRLPANVPPAVQKLLRLCLEKNAKKRLRDAGDALFRIEEAAMEPAAISVAAAPPRPLWRRSIPVLIAVFIAGSAASLATWNLKRSHPGSAIRFSVVLPEEQQLNRYAALAIAPDGARLVYLANGRLFLRSMGEMEARAIPGSDIGPFSPVFSPDGQWIAFYSTNEQGFMKIPVSGGAALEICKADYNPWGVSWDGDQILFAQLKGIFHVSASGGEPRILIEAKSPETLYGPQLINEGKTLLFSAASGTGSDRWDKADIVVQTIASGERKVVLKGGSAARYVPSGHLIYAVGNTLMAIPFDAGKLEVRGSPVPVLEGLSRTAGISLFGGANFAVSDSGSLVFLPGISGLAILKTTPALADRSGKVWPLGLPPAFYQYPRMSPDAKHMAFETDDGKEAIVWIYDLKAGGSPRRLTFGGRNWFPIWSRDGRYITFASDREGNVALFRQLADGSGTAERLTKADLGPDQRPNSWHPDGKTLSFSVGRGLSGTGEIWTLSIDPDGKPEPLVEGPANERYSVFSPDGHWIAYASSDQLTALGFNVFVQPYPPTGAKYQISTEGGRDPLWSPDGKQLFFNTVVDGTPTGKLSAVDVRTQPSFTFGKPTPIPITGPQMGNIQMGGLATNYDITPDGKQFLVLMPVSGSTGDSAARPAAQQIDVVLNWFEELKKRVPVP